jgi:hypothetical protein
MEFGELILYMSSVCGLATLHSPELPRYERIGAPRMTAAR